MFYRTQNQGKQPAKIENLPYREDNEIARVMLMGNSEIIIYRDAPGHLLFGLFNPATKKPQY
jgi:hypothetical protein